MLQDEVFNSSQRLPRFCRRFSIDRLSSVLVHSSTEQMQNTHVPKLSVHATAALCNSDSRSNVAGPTTAQVHTNSGDETPPHSESSSSATSHSSASTASSKQFLEAAFGAQAQKATSSTKPTGTQAQNNTTNNGRQRATSLMAPNEMPQRLTKNYKELARDFRVLKPFTRLPDGTYPVGTRCVFCEIGAPKTVFFPCQHKCVCDVCMKLHDISADCTRPSAWR